jgi:hypothetical protein
MKFIQPYIFKSLPFIAAGATGKISIDQPDVTKVQLYHPVLHHH